MLRHKIKIRKDIVKRKKVDARWEARRVRKSKVEDKRSMRLSALMAEVAAGRNYGKTQGKSGKGASETKPGLKKGRSSAVGPAKPVTSVNVAKASLARLSRKAMKQAKKKERGRKAELGSMEGKKTLVRNRCVDTGHGRSVIRWFRKSGRKVRERGRRGKLEGVFRVSW